MNSNPAESLPVSGRMAHFNINPGLWFVGFNLYFDLILLTVALAVKWLLLHAAVFVILHGPFGEDLYASPGRLLFQTAGSAGVLAFLLFLIWDFHRRRRRFRKWCVAYLLLLLLCIPTILFSEKGSLVEDLRSNPFELFDWFPDLRGLILNLLRYGLWLACLLFSKRMKEMFIK